MGEMNKVRRILIVGTVVSSCVGCDQATKALAHRHLAGADPISFLGDVIRLSYVENAGAFLGLGADLPQGVRFWLFVVAVASGLTLLTWRSIADRSIGPWQVLAIAVVVGGGVGNLIDRASYGVARDFLNLGVGNLRTGIFNVADMAVTVGAVALLADWWRGRAADRISGRPHGGGRP